ncbi:ABC transporter substrate-binding protein [Craterilacuibacter sp.]|uniref:ABC transporter substrate-binding protein n=1 Tax=Craterilacuibacter sp. TaxID=2870909 RepID=UPI003F3C3F57
MKHTLLTTLLLALLSPVASANWNDTLAQARGQTVYFNAWGGSEPINRYIAWAGAETQKRYGVTVKHVKIADTAEVIRRVAAEKAAARRQGGSVDLVWLNGENFRAMKQQGLLSAAFAQALPNWRYVDRNLPVEHDFAEPTQGLESPWGGAQLTFIAERNTVATPPDSMLSLLAFAQKHPGRVSYPKPPQFHGTSFLKQALLELTPTPALLQQPVTAANFARASQPLWAYLERLHPALWRQGKAFPASGEQTLQMMADGELLLGISFNPNEVPNQVASARLPKTAYSYGHKAGMLANVHFVAIPFNAKAAAGAQVLANFLLSPEAQARKADIAVWGDPSVLDAAKLPAAQQAALLKRAPGSLPASVRALPEPHASWVDALEKEWLRRYGQAGGSR